MKAIAAIVLLVCFAGFAAVSQADYQSAKRKFQVIDKNHRKQALASP